ncbi:MAG: MarR family winged helix-turn-helix transcriptional regulator [Candidatus Eisenbacteria bacterium]
MSLADELHQKRPFSTRQEEALVSIFATGDLLYRSTHRLLHSYGITLAQYNVLRILRGAGDEGLPLMSIARRMIVRYPNVTRLTDRLEADGWIRRERSTKDRRVVRGFVSRKGLDLLASLDGPIRELNQQLMRGAGVEDLDRLIRILEAIRAPLRAEEESLAAEGNGATTGNGVEEENGQAGQNQSAVGKDSAGFRSSTGSPAVPDSASAPNGQRQRPS